MRAALAWLCALALAAAAAREPRSPRVVMLRDQRYLREVLAPCAEGGAARAAAGGSDGGNSTGCRLPGACGSLVFHELAGLAGDFTDAEVAGFQDCLADGIAVIEDDVEVRKTEHDYRLPLSGAPATPGGRRRLSQGSERPNFDPALLALSWPLQADAASMSASGLQASYFNASSSVGEAYVRGFKVQQLQRAQWNLDRMDQHGLPLDRQYGFGSLEAAGTGRGVTIYVVDSGIRVSHQEFQPWRGGASRASEGYNFAEQRAGAPDCDGHGTHVASTAAGRSVGVAKEAAVVGVRVLDCEGSGTVSNVVAGLNWVASNARKPAVATLSLGVPQGQWSDALDQAVTSLIHSYGITTVVASGNSKVDSCTIVPANVEAAITVAAADLGGKFGSSQGAGAAQDVLYPWDNTGACISVFAPGVDILAACGGQSRCPQLNESAYTWASGTSMAVPHVAGLAAIYLGRNTNAMPKQVKAAIVGGATEGLLDFSDANANVRPGTPNRLANSLQTGSQDLLVSASQGP